MTDKNTQVLNEINQQIRLEQVEINYQQNNQEQSAPDQLFKKGGDKMDQENLGKLAGTQDALNHKEREMLKKARKKLETKVEEINQNPEKFITRREEIKQELQRELHKELVQTEIISQPVNQSCIRDCDPEELKPFPFKFFNCVTTIPKSFGIKKFGDLKKGRFDFFEPNLDCCIKKCKAPCQLSNGIPCGEVQVKICKAVGCIEYSVSAKKNCSGNRICCQDTLCVNQTLRLKCGSQGCNSRISCDNIKLFGFVFPIPIIFPSLFKDKIIIEFFGFFFFKCN